MSIEETLTETFTDHEHLVPDADDVLRDIHAELDRGRHQHRARVAPILAAVAILAVALIVIVTRSSTGHTSRPGDHSSPTKPLSPKAAAGAAAQAILHSIQLPPAARASATEPAVLRDGPITELSSLQAKASAVWLAPGTVSDAATFASAHPPAGFRTSCTCGSPTLTWVNFRSKDLARAITYVIAPDAAGVAIKITVIVPWVPARPRWSYVADTATSVDVTVQRARRAGPRGGAPTVHRTLTPDATRRLALMANSLHPQAPSRCIGPLIMVAARDKLVFHEPTRTITFTMNAAPCPQFRVDLIGHNPVYLATNALDAALLRELHLPRDYGH